MGKGMEAALGLNWGHFVCNGNNPGKHNQGIPTFQFTLCCIYGI